MLATESSGSPMARANSRGRNVLLNFTSTVLAIALGIHGQLAYADNLDFAGIAGQPVVLTVTPTGVNPMSETDVYIPTAPFNANTNRNPFLNFRCTAIVTPPGSAQTYEVPGYYVGDHGATFVDTSNNLHIVPGTTWQVKFTPATPGIWHVRIVLEAGVGNDIVGTNGYNLPINFRTTQSRLPTRRH